MSDNDMVELAVEYLRSRGYGEHAEAVTRLKAAGTLRVIDAVADMNDGLQACERELSAVRLELQAAVRERDQYRDALERVADSYAPLSQDDMGIARAALGGTK